MARCGLSGAFLLLFVCFLHGEATPATQSTTDPLASCWQDLASDDAELAYRATWRLIQNPEPAVKLLREHLKAASAPDLAQIQGWIDDLSSPTFAVREKANARLRALEELAEPPLRKQLEANLDLETRRRVESLLSKLDQPTSLPEKLRQIRAIEVLEALATPQAKELLQLLAKGHPTDRQTREAKESLLRVAERKPVPESWLAWTKRPPDDKGDDPLPFGARARLGTTRFRQNTLGYHLAFTPDSRHIVSRDNGGINVWDAQSGKLQRRREGTAACLAVAPKGTQAAIGLWSMDQKSGSVVFWDWQTGKETGRWELPPGGLPREVAFSPDGVKVFCRTSDEYLRAWNLDSSQEATLWQPDGDLRRLNGFSLDGNMLVVTTGKLEAFILNLLKDQKHPLPSMDSQPGVVAFSPDVGAVAVCSVGDLLYFRETSTGKPIWQSANGVRHQSVHFLPDGKVFASDGYRQEIGIWDVSSGKFLKSLPGSYDCTIGDISPDGRWLASSGQTIKVWNLETGQQLDVGHGHEKTIFRLAFSPSYEWIATFDSRTGCVWNPPDGKHSHLLTTKGDTLRAAPFLPMASCLPPSNLGRNKVPSTCGRNRPVVSCINCLDITARAPTATWGTSSFRLMAGFCSVGAMISTCQMGRQVRQGIARVLERSRGEKCSQEKNRRLRRFPSLQLAWRPVFSVRAKRPNAPP